MLDVLRDAAEIIKPHSHVITSTSPSTGIFNFFFTVNIDLNYLLQQINLIISKGTENQSTIDIFYPQNHVEVLDLIKTQIHEKEKSDFILFLTVLTSFGLLDSETTKEEQKAVLIFIYENLVNECESEAFSNYKNYFYTLFIFGSNRVMTTKENKEFSLRKYFKTNVFSSKLMRSFQDFSMKSINSTHFQVVKYFTKINLEKEGQKLLLNLVLIDPTSSTSISFLQKQLDLKENTVDAIYNCISQFYDSLEEDVIQERQHLLKSFEINAKKDCPYLASKIYEKNLRDFEKEFFIKYADKEVSIEASKKDQNLLKNLLFSSLNPENNTLIRRSYLIPLILENEEEYSLISKCIKESLYNRVLFSQEGLDILLAPKIFTNDSCFHSLKLITSIMSSTELTRVLFSAISPHNNVIPSDFNKKIKILTELLETDPFYTPINVGPSLIDLKGVDLQNLKSGISIGMWIFFERTDSSVQIPILTLEGKIFSLAVSKFQNKIMVLAGSQVYEFPLIRYGGVTPMAINMKANDAYLLLKITIGTEFQVQEVKIGISNAESSFRSQLCISNDDMSMFLLSFTLIPYEDELDNIKNWLINNLNSLDQYFLNIKSQTDIECKIPFLENKITAIIKKSSNIEFHPLLETVTRSFELKILLPLFAFATNFENNSALTSAFDLLRKIFAFMPNSVNIFVEKFLDKALFHILEKCRDEFFDSSLYSHIADMIDVIQDKKMKDKLLYLITSPNLIQKYDPSIFNQIFKHWSNKISLELLNITDLLAFAHRIDNEILNSILFKICHTQNAEQVIKSIIAFAASHDQCAYRFNLLLTEIISDETINFPDFPLVLRSIEDILQTGNPDLAAYTILILSKAHQRNMYPFSLQDHLKALNLSQYHGNQVFVKNLIGFDIPDSVPLIIDLAYMTDFDTIDQLYSNTSIDFSNAFPKIIEHLDDEIYPYRERLYKAIIDNGCANIADKIACMYQNKPNHVLEFLKYASKCIKVESNSNNSYLFVALCFHFLLFQKIDNNWTFKLNIDQEGRWIDIDLASESLKLYQSILDSRILKYDIITSGFLMRFAPEVVREHLVYISSMDFSGDVSLYKDFIIYMGRRFNIGVNFLSTKQCGFESMDLFTTLKPLFNDISFKEPVSAQTVPPKQNLSLIESFVESNNVRILQQQEQLKISETIWDILWFKLTQRGEFYEESLYPKPIFQGYEKVDNFVNTNWLNVRFKPNKRYTIHADASIKRDGKRNTDAVANLENEKKTIENYQNEYNNTPLVLRVKHFTTSMIRTFEYLDLKNIGENEKIIFEADGLYINQAREVKIRFVFKESIFIVTSDAKKKAFLFKDIKCCLPRTHYHHLNSLQFVLHDGSSYFFCFPGQNSTQIIDIIKIHMPSSVDIYKSPIGNFSFGEITQRWSVGEVSNFAYLMHLNNLAGRNTYDICQYPFMPWALGDYRVPLSFPPRPIQEMAPKNTENDEQNGEDEQTENSNKENDAKSENSPDQIEEKPKIEESNEISALNPELIRDMSKPLGAMYEPRLKFLKIRSESLEPPHLYSSTHISGPSIYLLLIRTEPFATLHIKFQSGQFDRPMRVFSSIANNHEISLTQRNDFFEVPPEFYFSTEFLTNMNKYDFGGPQDVILPPWASSPHEFVDKHRKILEMAPIEKWIDLVFGYLQRGQNAEKANNVYMPYLYSNIWEEKDCPPPEQVEIMLKAVGQVPPQLFTSPHPARQVLPPKCIFQNNYNFKVPQNMVDVCLGFINDGVKGVARDKRGVFYRINGQPSSPLFNQIEVAPQTAFSLSSPASYFFVDSGRHKIIYRELSSQLTTATINFFSRIDSISSTNNYGTAITGSDAFCFRHNSEMILNSHRRSIKPYVCSAIRKEFDLFVVCTEEEMSLYSLRRRSLFKTVKISHPTKVLITPVFGHILLMNNEFIELFDVNGFFIKRIQQPDITSIDIGRFRDCDVAYAALANGSIVTFDVFDMKFKVILEGHYNLVKIVRNGNCILCVSEDGNAVFVPFSL
ncbi:Beige/BEACH domain containing protein [Trichomonas vaginalis G3]|uniref:Beige/BEACH domain containing protein n=1 Tax=Trichomonas vaginalis (strain ATCC PRA-98 / G3) TaxID=412133 RepID=A2DV52_TRIV3|nr:platelet formation protein family [Trichomonas vaginalis G3]EAY15779.1 Beige/BEACH domain containing protein [Trichomonas vaginalis G3]KAI5486550.1 platelet formation protein family [Trichomonas vaginalis G3]|eukprot:XP_001328002.1 Beige/BEACH domain containing protein [Trichomonas vaginalis G3]